MSKLSWWQILLLFALACLAVYILFLIVSEIKNIFKNKEPFESKDKHIIDTKTKPFEILQSFSPQELALNSYFVDQVTKYRGYFQTENNLAIPVRNYFTVIEKPCGNDNSDSGVDTIQCGELPDGYTKYINYGTESINIFNFLDTMPKASMLNVTNTSILDIEWLLNQTTYTTQPTGICKTYNSEDRNNEYNCYINSSIIETGNYFNPLYPELLVFAPKNPDSSIWVQATAEYVNSIINELRDCLTISSKPPSTPDAFNLFQIINFRYTCLLDYSPFAYDAYVQAFSKMAQNNIQNVEISLNFSLPKSTVADISETDYYNQYVIPLYTSILNQLMLLQQALANSYKYNNVPSNENQASGKTTLDIKLSVILSIPKTLNLDDMSYTLTSAYNLTKGNVYESLPPPFNVSSYQSLLNGIIFSTDNSSSINYPIEYYSSLFLETCGDDTCTNPVPPVNKNIPYHFDISCAKELNWTFNNNMIDAYLLKGTGTRVSNVNNITQFPYLTSHLAENGIIVEVSPISDQMFQYWEDIRTNPGNYLVEQLVPVVITPEYPAMFGYSGMTYDYFAASVGWNISLLQIKQLLYNSLSNDNEEVQKTFNGYWDQWVKWQCSQLHITIDNSLQQPIFTPPDTPTDTFTFPVTVNDYSSARNELIALNYGQSADFQEIKFTNLQIDSGGPGSYIFLNTQEYSLNDELSILKESADKSINLSQEFFTNNKNLYTDTNNYNLYSFLDTMPKGALLNINNRSITNLDWILNNAGSTDPTGICKTYTDVFGNVWTCYFDKNILNNVINTATTDISPNLTANRVFQFNTSVPSDSGNTSWTDATSTDGKAFIKAQLKSFISLLTINNLIDTNTDTSLIIRNINLIYDSLLICQPFAVEAYYNGLMKLANANIQHVEICVDFNLPTEIENDDYLNTLINYFSELYSYSGSVPTVTNDAYVNYIQNTIDSIIKAANQVSYGISSTNSSTVYNTYPYFTFAIILSGGLTSNSLCYARQFAGDDLSQNVVNSGSYTGSNNEILYQNNCYNNIPNLQYLQSFEGIVVGFQIIGSRTNNNELYIIGQIDNTKLKFYYVFPNVIDNETLATLNTQDVFQHLTSISIGGVWETGVPFASNLIQYNVCFNTAPINEQMLQYYYDVKDNVSMNFFNRGVPVVISANNTVMYGYVGSTYDYMSATISYDLDLQALKYIVYNSLAYSSLGPEDLAAQINQLDLLWANWVTTQFTFPLIENNILASLENNDSSIINKIFSSSFQDTICTSSLCYPDYFPPDTPLPPDSSYQYVVVTAAPSTFSPSYTLWYGSSSNIVVTVKKQCGYFQDTNYIYAIIFLLYNSVNVGSWIYNIFNKTKAVSIREKQARKYLKKIKNRI